MAILPELIPSPQAFLTEGFKDERGVTHGRARSGVQRSMSGDHTDWRVAPDQSQSGLTTPEWLIVFALCALLCAVLGALVGWVEVGAVEPHMIRGGIAGAIAGVLLALVFRFGT